MLGVAVQHAVTSTALGCAWPAPLHPSQHADPPLERVLELAVGDRWNAQARGFVRDLVRLKAYRAPLLVRAAATAAWARRWWNMLSVAVQQAVASTALGGALRQPLQPEAGEGPPLDSVIHHAAPEGQSRPPLRPPCAATQRSVSPLTRAGRPVPGADARAGVALVAARSARYPERGRWSDECQQFLRTLLRLRVQRAPPPLRASAAQGWARRWWSVLSVALQRAVASSALGVWTMPPMPGAPDTLLLSDVLDLASA
ncbi:unnamed protein product, partial [Symbiodinium natans]